MDRLVAQKPKSIHGNYHINPLPSLQWQGVCRSRAKTKIWPLHCVKQIKEDQVERAYTVAVQQNENAVDSRKAWSFLLQKDPAQNMLDCTKLLMRC